MKGTKRSSLGTPKKLKRKKTRLVRNIMTYLKSNAYFLAPLFSNSPPLTTQIQTHPPSNSESSKADEISMAEALGIEKVIKKKRRMSEKVKEYLKSYCYMYGPMISPLKLGSSLKGKLQITNLVTMEVSTSTTTTREDNNYRSLGSEIAEQTLPNGRIKSPKRSLVILEGQRTGLSHETELSPAYSSLPGQDGEARSKESYN